MTKEVNGRARAYDASGRRSRAAATRAAILDAARQAFLEHGFAATTVPAIAAAAEVSVETVYKAFGNKAGLVKAVFDVAIVGDDEPIPLMERAFIQRNIAEPDPRVKLADYGAHLGRLVHRTHPVLLMVRDAAVSDASAAGVWQTLQNERLTGMTAFATHLRDQGHLRAGITMPHARDVLWTHNSVELWDLLVRQRGWAARRYGAWIGEQLIAALL